MPKAIKWIESQETTSTSLDGLIKIYDGLSNFSLRELPSERKLELYLIFENQHSKILYHAMSQVISWIELCW
jgi:uncharacterized FlaG/YvyC family protein